MGSVRQRAAKLLAIKHPGRSVRPGPGRVADVFMRPSTLKASNFTALKLTEPIFAKLKDLNPLKKHAKNQEASSI